ncbi:Probable serine/threonine-protein kinase PIX13 [Linum grandiflorum]
MGNCLATPPADNDHNPHTTAANPEATATNDVVENTDGSRRNTSSNAAETASVNTATRLTSLKIFKLAELKSATRNFRPDMVLGEGGFGTVFKGWIDDRTFAPSTTTTKAAAGFPVAVKRSNPGSSQGLEEWQCEVRFLGKFSHPNLVKLLGYCWEENHFFLVYEFMQKGSLEHHLFKKGAEPLSWEIRLKIAIGAAQGLAFLHSSEKSVIYRDFKASNILLDKDFNAKLSDFGLAKFGPVNGKSHVTTRVMGTHGYAAPEYVATGHLYVKSDVYGFGVVLLEMLTGLRTVDTNRPSGEYKLVEWAKPSLSNKRKLKKLMDPRLEDQYPLNAALQAATLVLQCLEIDPKIRPSMEDVLERLKMINEMNEIPQEGRRGGRGRRGSQGGTVNHGYGQNDHNYGPGGHLNGPSAQYPGGR